MTNDPRQLAALIHAQETIASAGLDVGDVLTSLAGHVREMTGATGAIVELVDAEGIITHGAAESSAVQVGIRVPDLGATGRAFMQDRLVRWDEPPEGGAASGEGRGSAKSVIAAPLSSGSGVLGVVTVVSSRENGFTSEDEHCVRVIARFTGHQIVQAQRLALAERTSRLDPLTGLGNRRALDETLSHELARHIRYGRTLDDDRRRPRWLQGRQRHLRARCRRPRALGGRAAPR